MVPDVDSFSLVISVANEYLVELDSDKICNDKKSRYISARVDILHHLRRKQKFLLSEMQTKQSALIAALQRNMPQLAALIIELDHQHKIDYSMEEEHLELIKDAYKYWAKNEIHVDSLPLQLRGSLKYFADKHFSRADREEWKCIFE